MLGQDFFGYIFLGTHTIKGHQNTPIYGTVSLFPNKPESKSCLIYVFLNKC